MLRTDVDQELAAHSVRLIFAKLERSVIEMDKANAVIVHLRSTFAEHIARDHIFFPSGYPQSLFQRPNSRHCSPNPDQRSLDQCLCPP